MSEATANSSQLWEVREFWNNHVHDWKVAKSPAGTAEFFREIEDYRFEKLHYLPKVVDFEGYKDQLLLDLGCGVGNDLSRFVRGGARVVGLDLAPHSISLASKNFAQRGLVGSFAVMDGERLGVADDGSVVGIEYDRLESDDKFMRHLAQVVRNGLRARAGTCIDPKPQVVQGKTVCLVSCQRSPEPVFLKWRGTEEHSEDGDFYVRSGP